jgi:glucosamine-6-phosphate deaminase
MEIIAARDYDEMSRIAAELWAEQLRAKPNSTLIPAVGNTPMGMYRQVAELIEQGALDVSAVTVFQLDGYLGIPPGDPRSLTGWLRRSLVEPWKLREDQTVFLSESLEDAEQSCEEYVRKVREAGGIDFAVLGLGPNGHLGFNEPPSDAHAPTRIVKLTEESLLSNAAYWGSIDLVPKMSITAGMDILLAARRVVLLVSGERKRAILQAACRGPVHAGVPASFLQRHPNAIVIADAEAWPGDE